MRPPLTLAALAVVVGLVAACGGGSGQAAPAAVATSAACPPVAGPSPTWPLAVPATLPKPPGAVLEATTVQGGTTVVRFSTGETLRDAVLWTVREVRRAGFRLGRGDAEPTEADAPFSGPTVVGTYRMVRADECTTVWLLAVAPRKVGINDDPNSAPLLPYTPKGSPSPLPFGG